MSAAVAETATALPAVKLAPAVGLVRLTVGGVLVALVTVMLTAAEVVVAPALSVATAVRLWVPAVRPLRLAV